MRKVLNMCDALLLQRNEIGVKKLGVVALAREEKMREKSFTMQHYEELMNKNYYNSGTKFSQFVNMSDSAVWGSGAQILCPGMLGSTVLR